MSNLFNHACPLPSCYHSAPCFSVHFKGAVIDLVWLSCTTKRPFCLFTSWGVDAVGHESFAEHHSGGPFIFVTASSHTIDWYAYHHLDALGLWNPLKRFLVTDSMKPQFCWRWLRFLFWNTYRIPRNSRNWMLLKYIYIYIYILYLYYIVSLPNPRCGLSILNYIWCTKALVGPTTEVKAEDFLNCIYTAAGDSSGIEVEEFLLNLKCDAWRFFRWIFPQPIFCFENRHFFEKIYVCVYLYLYIFCIYIYIWRGDLSNLYVMLAFWNGGTLAKLFASWVF